MGGLQISCDFCKSPLTEPGGLLFTPIKGNQGIELKEHVCRACSQRVAQVLDISLPGKGRSGVYKSEPINARWHVRSRFLTKTDLLLLRHILEQKICD